MGCKGDIANEEEAIERDMVIDTDTGTTVIFGPVDSVATMFDDADIQYFVDNSTDITTLTGYYPCENPPKFGFGFPSISDATSARQIARSPVGHNSTIFDVLPTQLAQNRSGNNCTASIQGPSQYGNICWVDGQGIGELLSFLDRLRYRCLFSN